MINHEQVKFEIPAESYRLMQIKKNCKPFKETLNIKKKKNRGYKYYE